MKDSNNGYGNFESYKKLTKTKDLKKKRRTKSLVYKSLNVSVLYTDTVEKPGQCT